MARYQDARTEINKGLDLAHRLGAKRFEPFLSETLARIELAESHFEEAARIAERALSQVREFGAESFIGPWVMSTVALTTPDPERRRAILAEGEVLLAKGCVGHNYFRFCRNAMQACLNADALDEAERFADALADYTAEEPTLWSDFHIGRARRLVDAARGQDRADAIASMKQRAIEAELLNALRELDRGLTATDFGATET